MLVHNKEARCISIGVASKPDSDSQMVQVGEQKLIVEHHVILPGVQEIPADKWSALKKHPFIQHKMDEDLLVEVGGAPSGGKSESVESLAEFTPKKAVKLVEATVMADLLEKWKGSEKRADVKKAIDKQLKKLADVRRRTEEDKDEEGQGDEK